MKLDIEEIRTRLPHRYPFLLVDRVVLVEPGERIEAYKNLTINEPFFDGHFPGKAVFPGVLLLEAMAQAAGILGFVTMDKTPADGSIYYLWVPIICDSSAPASPAIKSCCMPAFLVNAAVFGNSPWRHEWAMSSPLPARSSALTDNK